MKLQSINLRISKSLGGIKSSEGERKKQCFNNIHIVHYYRSTSGLGLSLHRQTQYLKLYMLENKTVHRNKSFYHDTAYTTNCVF